MYVRSFLLHTAVAISPKTLASRCSCSVRFPIATDSDYRFPDYDAAVSSVVSDLHTRVRLLRTMTEMALMKTIEA